MISFDASQLTDLAKTDLSNLVPTSINQNLLPDTDLSRDLGSLSKRWNNAYVSQLNSDNVTTSDFS